MRNILPKFLHDDAASDGSCWDSHLDSMNLKSQQMVMILWDVVEYYCNCFNIFFQNMIQSIKII